MMENPVFPFTISAYENDHYTSSPYEFRGHFLKAFRKAASEGLKFYAYDVIVKSANEVSFVAYDMRDSCRGGIGEEVWRGEAIVPPELTSGPIASRIRSVATERFRAEVAAAKEADIQRHIASIMAEASL